VGLLELKTKHTKLYCYIEFLQIESTFELIK